MHRVYFDTNQGSHDYGYSLDLPASQKDLAGIGTELHDGFRVTIYMPEELEMQATLKFDNEFGYWIAMPVKGSIKYLDA